MSYFNPNRQRMARQIANYHMPFMGETITWKQWVSASTGVPEAGFERLNYYREQSITALIGAATMANLQQQIPAGQLADGQIRCTTREKLGGQDEIIWRNVAYRVDTNSQINTLNGMWMSILNRGYTGQGS